MTRKTREIKVGSVVVGGGAPVSVQTMATADPHDAEALLAQTLRCAEAGCDIIRFAVPDVESAAVLGEVRRRSPIPVVADVHFDHRCALAAIANGADALRLNPGNINSREKVREVAAAAKARGIPIRIGVNGGSLEKGETLVSSALKNLAVLEGEGFFDVVLSVKASDAVKTVEACRELAGQTDCPLHLGVTEAGTLIPGAVRNSVALGILLSDGIGETIRVSLTAKPEKEVKVGLEILRSLGLRSPGPAVTSCPTCGRTKVDVVRMATQVEEALETLSRDRAPGSGPLAMPKVAVMGCAVNGPGEAKGADIALCGGDGEFLLYVKGVPVGKVSEGDAVGKVVEYALRMR